MITVLITGANGFIAQHLACVLKREQFRVIGTSRTGIYIEGFERVFMVSLGESLIPVFNAEKVDVVVHCANAQGRNEYQLNVKGTSQWLEESQKHWVRLQIFLSSLSAGPDAISDYGKAKYKLEELFVAERQVVFKLGLVIGSGGMFARMVETICKSRIVPLLDSGNTPTYVLGIDNLCSIIRDCILDRGEIMRGKSWYIIQPKPYSLRDIMLTIKRQFGSKCRFIAAPSFLALIGLLILERLPLLKLPVNSNHVKGLIQSKHKEFPSDFSYFRYPEEELDQLVGKLKSG